MALDAAKTLAESAKMPAPVSVDALSEWRIVPALNVVDQCCVNAVLMRGTFTDHFRMFVDYKTVRFFII